MAEEYDYLFKSIVVGDGGVGKTALTLRFSKGFFTEDYKMTIGVDFHVKTITIDALEGQIRAKLQIWDTGGQERFSSIRPMYYRGSLGALLIFDLTNSASFEHLPQWIEEVRANIKNEIPLLLVGNKSDLIDQRAVSLEEINSFTGTFNLYYMETSAKTGEGVGDCFYILACLMIGSGVPDQLISSGIVFTPGDIPLTASQSLENVSPQIESEFDYAAPPVPEPGTNKLPESISTFEPEPDYAAPPVPEPASTELSESISTYEPEYEPEIPIPEQKIEEPIGQPAEFIFKTPEEILANNTSEASTTPNIEPTLEDPYKPRAVPFTSNIPIPAPAPKDFQPPQEVKPIETSQPKTPPFLVHQDSFSSQANVPFEEPAQIHSKKDKKKKEKQKKKDEKEKKLQEETEKQERLIEDMKKEKQKKKDEKEKKLQEEKEKQEKLIEDMKKIKKEKKEKSKKEKVEKVEKIFPKTTLPSQLGPEKDSSTTPSLFQSLSQKTDEPEKKVIASFVPFSEKEENKSQESSKLRIIPNIGDSETTPNTFTPIQNNSSTQAGMETITCKKCGSICSSDYLYCNKCGSKL